MSNNIFFTLLLVVVVSICHAQTEPVKVSDEARIALTPIIPEQNDMVPTAARNILINRLRQLATSNGYAGSAVAPQFILAANPVLLDKKVASAAPNKIWMELEMTLYIADYYSKSVFATTSVSLRGVGATDQEALMDAYKGFSISKSDVKAFAKKGREEILAFYNTRCDFIIGRVEMLANTNQADAALEMLTGIPEVSKSCFEQAMAQSEKIFNMAAEQRCQQLIMAAKAAWANAPNRTGAEKAVYYLGVIPPQAKCSNEANALFSEIKSKMLEVEKWERRQYTDQISLMRDYIKALRDIGVAYGEGQPDTQIQIKGWLW